MPRRSYEATQRTRREILARAADLASVEGLAGVTIGRLSDALFMSKSGLFAYFGSKEELQLAIVEAAAEAFDREVFGRLPDADPGVSRLIAIATAWIAYLEKGPFRGGCFFSAVSAEMDDRPGRVRDRVVELTRGWLGSLEEQAEAARDLGELGDHTEPAQLAFEIHAFVHEANRAFQLHGDAQAFRRAEQAVLRAIGPAASISDRVPGWGMRTR